MEHFIELTLELLFSFARKKQKKCPNIELNNEFTVSYNKIASIIILSVLFLAATLFFALSFFINNDTRILFYIFFALLLLVFLLFFYLFSVKYYVTHEKIQKIQFFFFKKEILWNDIICIRTIENDNDSNIIIALYNFDKICVSDISTDMDNAWYIIKMAEFKNIEIREEKNLTLKQIKKLYLTSHND